MANLNYQFKQVSDDGGILEINGQTHAVRINNFATSVPNVNNDEFEGYSSGSLWLNTATNAIFICTDNTGAAAVWVSLATSTGATTLAALTDVVGAGTHVAGNIIVDDGVNSFDSVAVGGDATLAASGALTIEDDAITTAKILDGNVTGDKLFTTGTTTDDCMIWNGLTWVSDSVFDDGSITSTTKGWSASKLQSELSALTTNLSWKDKVESIYTSDFSSLTPSNGDRYIVGTGATNIPASAAVNDIVEYDGSIWVLKYDHATEGDGAASYVDNEDTIYVSTDTGWSPMGGITDHNSLDNIDGGTPGEYYHLTNARHTALTSTTSDCTLHRHSTIYSPSGNTVAMADNNLNFGIEDGSNFVTTNALAATGSNTINFSDAGTSSGDRNVLSGNGVNDGGFDNVLASGSIATAKYNDSVVQGSHNTNTALSVQKHEVGISCIIDTLAGSLTDLAINGVTPITVPVGKKWFFKAEISIGLASSQSRGCYSIQGFFANDSGGIRLNSTMEIIENTIENINLSVDNSTNELLLRFTNNTGASTQAWVANGFLTIMESDF